MLSSGWFATTRGKTVLVVAMVLLLALAFQGTRGLWEPDEGFYANVALGMLHSGDWWVPRLNGEPFLDKPPLHYWGIAAGMAFLGANEWGARLANALFFAATALLVGALGRRMWSAAVGRVAALLYATTLAPFLAANVLTPDTPLAVCTAWVFYSYWRAEHCERSPGRRAGWWLAAGLGAGLGCLAKGPAMLVFLPPIGLHLLWQSRWKAVLRQGGFWGGAAAALVCGAAWYLWIARDLPGAWSYIADSQIVGRLWTARYQRNSHWWGPFKVYLPTLLLGGLPGSLFWGAGMKRLLRRLSAEGPRRIMPQQPEGRLLILWIAFPLLVLAAARSRLPLYLLPVFAPLALTVARRLANPAGSRSGIRLRYAGMASWCLLLLLVKAAAGYWPAYSDTRRLARELVRHTAAHHDIEVVAVDVNRNALPFYGFESFEWVTTAKEPYPFYTLQEALAQEVAELDHSPQRHLFILSAGNFAEAWKLLSKTGADCRPVTVSGLYPLILCEPSRPRPSARGRMYGEAGG